MELLQVQPAARPCVCPCVRQPLPCYCEERAGYSTLPYDCPLTVDTSVEYELKGLHDEIAQATTNCDSAAERTLLIDYNGMANTGYVHVPAVPNPHTTYWANSQNAYTPAAEATSPDLYDMIETLDVDLHVNTGGMEATMPGFNHQTQAAYDCYSAGYFVQGASYIDNAPIHTDPSGFPHYNTGDSGYTTPYNKWHSSMIAGKDAGSCVFPHNSTGSTASSTSSNYRSQCRAY